MDELEFRTGRKPNQHLARHAEAQKTVRPHEPVPAALLEPVTYPDGRIGWPKIVQYRLPSGELRDYPPTKDTHPDKSPPPKHAVMQRADKTGGRSVPYEVVIHHRAAYEELARSGRLRCDAHAGGIATVTDNRKVS